MFWGLIFALVILINVIQSISRIFSERTLTDHTMLDCGVRIILFLGAATLHPRKQLIESVCISATAHPKVLYLLHIYIYLYIFIYIYLYIYLYIFIHILYNIYNVLYLY